MSVRHRLRSSFCARVWADRARSRRHTTAEVSNKLHIGAVSCHSCRMRLWSHIRCRRKAPLKSASSVCRHLCHTETAHQGHLKPPSNTHPCYASTGHSRGIPQEEPLNTSTSVSHTPLPPSPGQGGFYESFACLFFIFLSPVQFQCECQMVGVGSRLRCRLMRLPGGMVGAEAYSISRNQISCPRAVSVQET